MTTTKLMEVSRPELGILAARSDVYIDLKGPDSRCRHTSITLRGDGFCMSDSAVLTVLRFRKNFRRSPKSPPPLEENKLLLNRHWSLYCLAMVRAIVSFPIPVIPLS
jgi:hypothetical protein